MRVDSSAGTALACVGEVEKFLIPFLVDVESMRAAAKLAAPAFDEFSLVVKDKYRVIALAALVDRVADVDAALGVFDDPMRVAVADVVGEYSPVVLDFIGEFASADDGSFRSRLVRRAEDGRGERGPQLERVFKKISATG